MLDKARKIRQKELETKERLKEEEERLRGEKRKAEAEYKTYRLSKLLSSIDKLLRDNIRSSYRAGFSSFMKYNIDIHTKIMKVYYIYIYICNR